MAIVRVTAMARAVATTMELNANVHKPILKNKIQ